MEDMMEAKPILLSALAICAALQSGEPEKAQKLLPQLQAELPAASGEQQLLALKNVLSMALRKRNHAIFKQLLEANRDCLCQLLAQQDLAAAGQDFLNFLLYNICDRRLVGQRQLAHQLVVVFTEAVPSERLVGFWNEWTSLTARIVRRKWLGEIEWLLTVMLRQLWRCQDIKLWYNVLQQLQMHLAMNCSFDSLQGTFTVYKPLFYSYLFIIDYVGRRALPAAKQEALLKLVLRSLRDSVNQIARGRMADQQEVYSELYQMWLKDARADNPLAENAAADVPIWKRPTSSSQKLERRIQRFLQMVITYWSFTNPKSSKKQLEYLKEVMEPRLLNLEEKKRLRKIS